MNKLMLWMGGALLAQSVLGPAHAAEAAPLRVMSFNVRYATAPDNENQWDKRKDLLTDTYRQLHPARGPDETTFHDFSGKLEGSRIDWIFCSPEFTPVEATIDRFSKENRYPSDHFPVTAVLR